MARLIWFLTNYRDPEDGAPVGLLCFVREGAEWIPARRLEPVTTVVNGEQPAEGEVVVHIFEKTAADGLTLLFTLVKLVTLEPDDNKILDHPFFEPIKLAIVEANMAGGYEAVAPDS